MSCYGAPGLLRKVVLLSLENNFHHSISGSREDRAVHSLTSMGPAIINGGVTTFLALLLLGFSQSHVFITFFKVLQLAIPIIIHATVVDYFASFLRMKK